MLKELFSPYFYTLRVGLVTNDPKKADPPVRTLELMRHRKRWFKQPSEVVDVLTLRGTFVRGIKDRFIPTEDGGGYVFSTTGKPFKGVHEGEAIEYARKDFQVTIGGQVYLAESPQSMETYAD